MNYELCKKLKDAGFTQDIESEWCYTPEGEHIFRYCGADFIVDCIEPTLSELIEACGENFRFLTRNKKGKFKSFSWKEGQEYDVCDTPEEAVANLWLELNKR